MYHDLIPPECWIDNFKTKTDFSLFSKKGDIYFYGWVMFEVIIGIKPENYEINEFKQLIMNKKKGEMKEEEDFISIILQCINEVILFFILKYFFI